MRYNYLLIIFSSLCWAMSTHAQSHLLDSLTTKLLNPAIPPEQKVIVSSDLALALRYTDIDQSVALGEESVELGRQLTDKKYLSYAWSQLYTIYRKAQIKKKTGLAADSAMYYAQQSGDSEALGMAHYAVGHQAYFDGNTGKEIEETMASITPLTQSQSWFQLTRSCHTLAGYYGMRNELKGNEKYARMALDASRKTDNPDVRIMGNFLMADYFEVYHKLKRDTASKDSAIYYFKQTLELYHRYESLTKWRFIGGNVSLNYANFLYSLAPRTTHQKIVDILNQGIVWAKTINDQPVLNMSYALLGDILSKQGNDEEAEMMLTVSLMQMERDSAGYYHALCNLTSSLINFYEDRGNTKMALRYYKSYVNYYQKLFDTKTMAKVNELEAQFDREKHEIEIAEARKESAFNKKIYLFSLSVAILSIILLFFIFWSYHLKLKSETQRKQMLEAENQEAQTKLLLHETQQKLIRQEKEQLQKEVLAGAVQIKEKNELLQTVRKEIQTAQSVSKLDRIIKENLQTDDHFEEYKSLVKEMHPDFFNHLQKQAGGKLTELDLKYCTYIYLKIPAKQMANMLHVEYGTVRINKHRLKQKLNLSKEDDLYQIIRNFEEKNTPTFPPDSLNYEQ